MFYKQYLPSTALRPYVKCYYVWEQHERLLNPLEVQSPPNGLGGIVFNYSDPGEVLNEEEEWEQVTSCFVAGQQTKNYSLRLSGKIGMIGIAFWPAGLSHLLGTPMAAFTGERFDLNLVLCKEAARLEHQVLERTNNNQRIDMLEQFLQQKLRRLKARVDVVDHALDAIIQKRGIISISKLSDDLCISPRQLRRRFTEKVGVSPKLFSRIKLFNYISVLSSSSLASWTDMVYEGGYYDQAHFIRDFSEFSGKRPSDFINYHRALATLVGA